MKLSTFLKGAKENAWITGINIALLHYIYHWYFMGSMPTGLFGWGVTISVSVLLFFTVLLWYYSDELAKMVGL